MSVGIAGKAWMRGRWTSLLSLFAVVILSLAGANVAQAQIESNPVWAVTDFAYTGQAQDTHNIGRKAADALSSELAKSGKYDVVAMESVDRIISTLGYQIPVTNATALARVGAEAQASTIVAGEITGYRFVQANGGKQAQILLRVIVYDVASTMIVNGAAIQGASGVRTGDVSDEALLTEALSDSAYRALREIADRTLPQATVLNTLETRALLNKGSRSGLVVGQRLVITRGSRQVAEGSIIEVDPDSSFIAITRQSLGVQPGDKARALFVPPDNLTWAKGTEPRVIGAKKTGGGSQALMGILVLVLLVAFLFGNGRGDSTTLVHDVLSQATLDVAGNPAVRVSWTRDAFLRGSSQTQGPFVWQVWRNDSALTPVAIAAGEAGSTLDTLTFQNAPSDGNPGYNFLGVTPGSCIPLPGQFTGEDGIPVIVPGTSYRYSVEVVIRTVQTGTSTGTAATATTGGATTGGAADGGAADGGAGGTADGGDGGAAGGTADGGAGAGGGLTPVFGRQSTECFVISPRANARGIATPLTRPALLKPDEPSQVSPLVKTNFLFQSVRAVGLAGNGMPLEYAVEISDRTDFRKGNVVLLPDTRLDLETPNGQTLSILTSQPVFSYFPSASIVYWRVGVKNTQDDPGPVADRNSGNRYIFSTFRRLERAIAPSTSSKSRARKGQ